MLELDHLTVAGDVWFGRNITLRGTVIIVANEGSRIDLPDGSILDNSEWSAVLQLVLTGEFAANCLLQSWCRAMCPSSITEQCRQIWTLLFANYRYRTMPVTQAIRISAIPALSQPCDCHFQNA